ncbi:hydratase [Variovorax gossypii]|uniref:Hydratase n=1 Tax=Variovorax gossypii TaxID=1679495 RepID=A0A431TH36_9BURK|nr:fumarylacetoacetate hydrolase family protein [Variovorax gossypii]RTQ32036.1 hydratase [Variovorax gossypii]
MTPQAVLDHYDQGLLWPADRPLPIAADVDAAYQQALALRALRTARGERPVGYKIGFTNRTIWPRYEVYAPIWGTVWHTTLARSSGGTGEVSLDRLCQPRLEPEIVFGIAATPPRDATLEELFGCIAWLAPGFEIVQSHLPGWKFTAADTVADGGLHARLLIGRETPVGRFATSAHALDELLGRARVRLYRGDELIEEGKGVNVLDGPLHALHHFNQELQRCPGAPALMPGDVVTTGTWTDAWPLEPGQSWRAEFDAPFDSLGITLR